MPAVNIFISYRRDDASGHAGRIFDRLDDRFPGAVFMDVAGLGPGVHFVRAIEQKLASCRLFIVVIGTSWLRILQQRAADAEEPDYARIEVATALRKGIPVIPLLVQGAQMPRRADLPDDLKALRDHQAVVIDDHEFRDDLGRLIKAIEGLHPQPPRPGPASAYRPKPAGLPVWLKLSLGLGAAVVVALIGVAILKALINPSPGTANNGFNVRPGGQSFATPPPPSRPADVKSHPPPPTPSQPAAQVEGHPPPPPALSLAGRWTVTRQDTQLFVGVLTLGPDGALVQLPDSTYTGTWNYDEGQRHLLVYAQDGGVLVSLRVAEWHQDHFHGQWFTSAGRMGVNIRPG